MAKNIVIQRNNKKVTIVRSEIETGSENPLTEHEIIINELFQKVKKLENEKMMLSKACSELNKGDEFAHVQDVATMIEKGANVLEIKATNEGNQSTLVTPLLNIAKNIRFSLRMCDL